MVIEVNEEVLPKQYDPKKTEDRWYQYWESRGLFKADPESPKPPYSIVIPPPNVTDILHLGHALNNSLQDILVRYKRIRGFETEWLPGIDHAGIATQVVVEKKLAEEGMSRQKLGREEFLKRVWQWKDRNADIIIEQLKKIGCSCDWDKTRFTMDEGLSRAVLEVFVHLYNKGLIYKGNYIVNWCPRCQTSLSDDEPERDERDGRLWYIKYKLKGEDEYITVATTRPETMLGDTAVAVHPKDKRYKKYIGKTAILPILDRELAIIGDEYVDPQFGTGAVKVTPAHDPNDFEVGNRHNLEKINVLNPDGSINQNGGKFKGLDRYECRKRLVAELKKKGLLEKEEKYRVPVLTCYRCHTDIEPYLSEQWFVKMKPLAEPAIKAVKEGTIRFYPGHWSKVYLHWMENIHDWCISRQLWWGHRIPVWYCDDCPEITVSKTTPESCGHCGSKNVHQEEDVLDTWFSSWLWPFSTFGWPEKTKELEVFYPTKPLFTASEIIFLWVGRMVMAGYEFMGKPPFTDVYIHGTVRDINGIKMSKSLGNGIDPLEIVRDYGADALRMTLVLVTPEGQDPFLAKNSFELGRNFCNKLWNAGRFVLSNLKDFEAKEGETFPPDRKSLDTADRWILSRFYGAMETVEKAIESYRFNQAGKTLYDFLWKDFCDWYLEFIKERLYDAEHPREKRIPQLLASHLLEKTLVALSPFVPYISEEIWQRLSKKIYIDGSPWTVNYAGWPQTRRECLDLALESEMSQLQEVIYSVRSIRAEMNVKPAKRADVIIKTDNPELHKLLEKNRHYITQLGKVDNLEISPRAKKPQHAASAVVRGAEIYVPLEGLIDLEIEKSRLEKEMERLNEQIDKTARKLNNKDFTNKAPPEVVERERAKQQEYQQMLDKIVKNIESLVGW